MQSLMMGRISGRPSPLQARSIISIGRLPTAAPIPSGRHLLQLHHTKEVLASGIAVWEGTRRSNVLCNVLEAQSSGSSNRSNRINRRLMNTTPATPAQQRQVPKGKDRREDILDTDR